MNHSGDDERANRAEEDHSQVIHDWQTFESATTAVVEAAAAATDRTVLELPPLQHAVDADSLNAMVEDRAEAEAVEVTFQYADLEIAVDNSGTLAVGTHGLD
jgi:hypothetical protein